MKRIFVHSILFAALLFSQSAFAGAWTQKANEGYFKLGFRMIRATNFYEPDGRKISIPTLGDYTTTFYGEYGIGKRVTLIASVPFRRITLNKQVGEASGTIFFEGDDISAFSDSEVGFRYGLLDFGHSVLSTEVLLSIPIGNDEQKNGLYTGDGEWNQSLKLQFGRSFYPSSFYFSTEAGFNNRTGGFSDEFLYGGEFGYTIKNKFLLTLKVRGVQSLKNGVDAITGGTAGLFANNQSYLAFGPEFSFLFNRQSGLSVSVESATLAKNIVSAPAFSVGLFLKK